MDRLSDGILHHFSAAGAGAVMGPLWAGSMPAYRDHGGGMIDDVPSLSLTSARHQTRQNRSDGEVNVKDLTLGCNSNSGMQKGAVKSFVDAQ